MMALQILPLLQLIIIFYTPGSLSYPNTIYGTKRYGRSNQRPITYDPYPLVTSQRYPVNYYKLYPYSQNFPEDYYYPQESYPMYYPPRASKYELYQAMMPYYYQDAAATRPDYYYGYNDPANLPLDWKEEMIQEAEREEREEAQPIGHESFYENDGASPIDPTLADANAAFLQNLILSQMYQDSLENDDGNYQNYNRDYDDGYGKFEEVIEKPGSYPTEDETVRELKQLQKENKSRQYRKQNKNKNDNHWVQKEGNNKKQRQNNRKPKEEKRSDSNELLDSFKGAMIYSDRKPVVKVTTSSESPSSTTEDSRRESRGQKEEFQMRPATPVRHPFASPVLAMMTNGDNERKRTPSVYDTIKHMLDMEKSLESGQLKGEIRPAMKKRIITSEENLTRQLTVLKKATQ